MNRIDPLEEELRTLMEPVTPELKARIAKELSEPAPIVDATNTRGASLLAAGVMMALAVGLFAMVRPTRPTAQAAGLNPSENSVKRTPAADGENENAPPPRPDDKDQHTQPKDTAVSDEERLLDQRRKAAQRAAEEARLRETQLFQQRIAKLLEQTEKLYEQLDYKAAEKLATQLLRIDPLNREAEEWKEKARKQLLAQAQDPEHLEKRQQEDIEKLKSVILKQQTTLVIERENAERARAEKKAMEEELNAAKEALAARKNLVDERAPSATKNEVAPPAISGRVLAVSPENCLIMLSVGSQQGLKQGNTFKIKRDGKEIGTVRVEKIYPDMCSARYERGLDILKGDDAVLSTDASEKNSNGPALAEAVELHIYDIADLTRTLADGSEAAGDNPRSHLPTEKELAELIHTRVGPGQWDPGMGTSIEVKSGQLAVMQRPKIHALIEQLLTQMRQAAKTIINIEARIFSSDSGKKLLKKLNKKPGDTVTDDELNTVPDANSLIAPRLTVFSGQHATVIVEHSASYISAYDSNTGEKISKELITGFRLPATATVSSDRRFVTLQLNPAVSELVRMDKKKTEKGEIEIPVLRVHEAKTTVTIPDQPKLMIIEVPETQAVGEKSGSFYMLIGARIVELKDEEKL